jgi:hypothetical protein
MGQRDDDGWPVAGMHGDVEVQRGVNRAQALGLRMHHEEILHHRTRRCRG